MKDIQITMGAVETLNERIHILQDELKELENQKTALEAQEKLITAKRIFMTIIKIVCGVIAGISFLLFMAAADDSEGEIAVLFLVITAIFGTVAFIRNTDETLDYYEKKIAQIEKSISIKKQELNEYKKKKKEVILENERKLSDTLEEKITEDFSFNDIADFKECPMCAESVKLKAHICRYCGYEFK